LAHAFLWEYSYKRLKLAQLLGQLCVFLTPGSLPAHGWRPGAEYILYDTPAMHAFGRRVSLGEASDNTPQPVQVILHVYDLGHTKRVFKVPAASRRLSRSLA
jgi:hypothetical protein